MSERTSDIGDVAAAAKAVASKAPDVVKGVATQAPRLAKEAADRLPAMIQLAVENGMRVARRFAEAAPGLARTFPGAVRATPDLVRSAPDLAKAAPALAGLVADRIVAVGKGVLAPKSGAAGAPVVTERGSVVAPDPPIGAKPSPKAKQRIAIGESRPAGSAPARRTTKPVSKPVSKPVAKKKVVKKVVKTPVAAAPTEPPAPDQSSASVSIVVADAAAPSDAVPSIGS